jgi:hypothetical protein
MKNKSFDCVEMKRKAAEAVYQKVMSLNGEPDNQSNYYFSLFPYML